MALPTVNEVTNMYLYGQTNTPQDLADNNILRPNPLPTLAGWPQPEIHVNVVEYMKDGGGRNEKKEHLNLGLCCYYRHGQHHILGCYPERSPRNLKR